VDRVLGDHRRDHVERAVAVEVARRGVPDAVGGAVDQVVVEDERVAAQVLVPGDVVADRRRRQQVEVAVAIEVEQLDRVDAVDVLRVGRGQPEGAVARAALEAVPRHLVRPHLRRHQVEVAIAVEVAGIDARRAVAHRIDVLHDRRPRRGVLREVLVPDDRVRGRRRQQVEVAVAIEIAHRHRGEALRDRADDPSPERAAAQILEPDDLGGSVGRRDHVDVAVGIEVDRDQPAGELDADAQGLGREPLLAVVLVPDDDVGVGDGRHQIEVAVAVEIDPGDGAGQPRDARQGMLGEPQAAVVLPPGEDAFVVRGGEQVEIAVAVDVGRGHLSDPGGLVRDDRAGERTTEVLEHGDHLVGGRRGDQVGIAVAVEVRRGDAPPAAGDQVRDRVVGEGVGAQVLVPMELRLARRGDQIQVAVPVEIGAGELDRSEDVGRHQVRGELERAVVLVPADQVRKDGHLDQIGITVAIDVEGEDELRSQRAREEGLLRGEGDDGARRRGDQQTAEGEDRAACGAANGATAASGSGHSRSGHGTSGSEAREVGLPPP